MPRILAIFSLLCFLTLLVSAETGGTPPAKEPVIIDPALLTFVINRAVHNKADNEEGIFEGGVAVWYEHIRLASDLIHYWQSPLGAVTTPVEPVDGARVDAATEVVPRTVRPGGAVPPPEGVSPPADLSTPSTAAVVPPTGPDGKPLLFMEKIIIDAGPDGPEPDRIHLDTRFTQLETINFRGLLRPRRLVMQRLAQDPEHLDIITYRLTIPGLGDFRGYLLRAGKPDSTGVQKSSWVPCIGYSDIAEIIIEMNHVNGVLQNPRIRRIELIAPQQVDDQGKDYVMLEVHDPDAVPDQQGFSHARILSKGRIILEFREDGSLGDQRAEGYTLIRGLPVQALPDMTESVPEITPDDYWDKATKPKTAPAKVPTLVPDAVAVDPTVKPETAPNPPVAPTAAP